MDSYDILVIILSVTLAIFLILAIILTVIMIKIMKKVDRVTDQAEVVANNIAEASKTVKQFAGPTAIVQMFAKLIRR